MGNKPRKGKSDHRKSALSVVTKGVHRVLAQANGDRHLRTLGVEDARHMLSLLSFSYLGMVRDEAAQFGIDLGGLDADLDDKPFAVAVGDNQRFVSVSKAGLSPHGWAYPDSWKLPKDEDEQYLGEFPKTLRPSTQVTRAMVVFDREQGAMTFGAARRRADAFIFPWAEVISDMALAAQRFGVGTRRSPPEVADEDDSGREVLMSEASFQRRLGGRMRRDLIEAHENVQRMETIEWALLRWARRRRSDRVRFRMGAGELFAVSGSPG